MINQAVLMTVARVVILALGLAANVLIARLLGPDGQGLYAIGITLAAVLAQFGNLGLHNSNTYLVAHDESISSALYLNNRWIAMIGGTGLAIIVGVVMLGWQGWDSKYAPIFLLGVATVPPRLLLLLDSHVLVGLKRHMAFNGLQFAQYLLVFIAVALAGYLEPTVGWLLVANVLAWWGITFAWLYVSSSKRTSRSFNAELFKSGYRYAAKSYIACLAPFLLLRGHIFLIGYFHDDATVGQFAIALQIFDVTLLPIACLALILLPQLVSNPKDRGALLVRNLLFGALYMLVACAICGLLVKPFVTIVFGSAFEPVARLVWFLLPAMFFQGMQSILSQYLNATGLPKWFVASWVATMLVSLSLGLLLVPANAAIGSAMALSIAMGIMFFGVLAVVLIADSSSFGTVSSVTKSNCAADYCSP